jgi:hypothetical protein
MSTMTLATARTIAQRSVRNGTDSSAYSATDLDIAIAALGQRFCRVTRYLRATSSQAVAAGVYDLGTLPCHPAEILSATASGQTHELERIPWATLLSMKLAKSATGLPRYLAFRDAAYGECYPAPAAASVISLRYVQQFTTWTPGTTDAVTLNLPAEVLYEILPVGCRKYLQQNEPENAASASRAWAEYLEVEKSYAGQGDYAATVAPRDVAF